MSVYVDPIMPCIPNKNWRYHYSCHLVADTVAELYSFAVCLGLKRVWFQDKRIPHYDLTANKCREAMKLGAIEIDTKGFGKLLKRQRI